MIPLLVVWTSAIGYLPNNCLINISHRTSNIKRNFRGAIHVSDGMIHNTHPGDMNDQLR